VAKSYNNIAIIYRKQAKYEEALEMYTKSLHIKTRIHGGDNHPDVAASKYNLALLRRQRNETDIARQLFRECEQIYITVYGPDHSETVDAARQASRCV
jgi:tetratricopeptide (TPR) repeat protein